jgi:topoisomerase-4 subunit A
MPAHTLPSARGQGEPLTGRVNPPAGAEFLAVLMGESEEKWLLASDLGYGFVAKLDDLVARNRAGKAVLTVPEKGKALAPCRVMDVKKDLLVTVSNEGRMLVFPVKDLPELSKGKGNKIIAIDTAKHAAREEYVVGAVVITKGDGVTVFAGKRHLTLKGADLQHYMGERGRRGNMLPRGFQRVESISRDG